MAAIGAGTPYGQRKTGVADDEFGGVEPNRAVDKAAVDVRLNRNPFPNAQEDDWANENLEKVPGLEEARNNSWDWDFETGCEGSDSVGPPRLNANDADDPLIENLSDNE